MAGINAALSNMFRSTPRNSVSGKVELPQREDEPLTGGEGLKSDKCELRIEGMTCGACVEVRNLSYPTATFLLRQVPDSQ